LDVFAGIAGKTCEIRNLEVKFSLLGYLEDAMSKNILMNFMQVSENLQLCGNEERTVL